ncbi:HpcH/HpaI aldolase/citrate lyase family protein [Acuticoccus sp.]|uniref:HpcH/HpaI aldolase/citrate lyase family protein n=1 Tax=Acuticoccus sp. TaxID=1904378 RepID=UPI003B52DC1D
MSRPLPVWRSLLFVPVNVERYVEKAHARGADAIQLDLEDSVPLAQKAEARTMVREAARRVSTGGADVVVRINRPVRMALADLEACVWPEVGAIALPKVAGAVHVRLIAEVIDELEAERGMPVGTTKLIAMIETAEAYFEAREIAAAHPRLVGLNLGAEDFAVSTGMLPEADGLYVPKMTIVMAARAAGVLPLGFIGTVADYADLDAFRATIRRSRRLGFRGSSCIHPGQVAILNEEFAPSPEEVDHAQGMLSAYDDAIAAGRGSVEYRGKMIDVPVVERARELIAVHDAIAARQGGSP